MKRRLLLKGLILLAGCAVLALYCALDIQCIFRRIFGVICPGCGMTRAILACLRLDFPAALRYHPMVLTLPVLFIYFIMDGNVFKRRKVNIAVLAAICAGFAANYVHNLVVYYF
jgi:hypothetical protein